MNTLVLTFEIVVLSIVTIALWWSRHRDRLSTGRLHIISIRMRFVQLNASGKIKGGNLSWLLDKATTASLDDKGGLTLWELAQRTRNLKGQAIDFQVRTLVEELDSADPEVRELFLDYISSEKKLLLERSPFLVFCIKFLVTCGRFAERVKKFCSPVIMGSGKQRFKAYYFYESLDSQLHQSSTGEPHILAVY
jgi:hypothetical protein